jgi:hypothetical protein
VRGDGLICHPDEVVMHHRLFGFASVMLLSFASGLGCDAAPNEEISEETGVTEEAVYSPYPGCYCDPSNPPPDMTCFWVCLQQPTTEVEFFEHLSYSGASLSASSSNSFVGWDWNDRITSVHVPYGRTVVLYEHWNYEGASVALNHSEPDLRNIGWNDRASSFKIY